jgi:predicted lipoprotein with Yx(FWY)xxD motif
VLGVVAVAVIAGGAYWLSTGSKPQMLPLEAVRATPPGITLQKVKIGTVTMVPGSSSDQQEQVAVYADAAGKTLYTFDKDTEAGKSACTGDCLVAWPVAVAPADFKPAGNWSVITRDDGTKQWAFKGKPLYNFSRDKAIGDGKGEGVAQVWHLARLNPADGMALPNGVSVQEVAEAAGQVLVDSRGMPLYAFDGDVKSGKVACASGPCGAEWQPLLAGQLANPTGDFTIVDRDDGIQQWAYRGHPLFTYTNDVEVGDANGKGVDAKLQLAMIERYFLPPGVTVIPNEAKGGLLATTDGKTLYARDRVRFDGTGGHSARGADRGVPVLGMTVGTSGCDGDCLKEWKPFLAAADAQPSGYWTLMKRDDGTQQWAYQSYAVYTFTGDKKPGDMIGQDIYNLKVGDGQQMADARYGMGLYWRVTPP